MHFCGFSSCGSHTPAFLISSKPLLLLHGPSKIASASGTLPWKAPLHFCMNWSFTPFRFLLKNCPLKDSISLLIKEIPTKTTMEYIFYPTDCPQSKMFYKTKWINSVTSGWECKLLPHLWKTVWYYHVKLNAGWHRNVMEKLLYMGIKRHTQACLAALFKERKVGNNPNVHPPGNESIGFAHSPNNHNSAVKMNERPLHAVWTNDKAKRISKIKYYGTSG